MSTDVGVDVQVVYTDEGNAVATLKLSTLEILRIEAGEGADIIGVDDLRTATHLSRLEVDAGRGEIFDRERLLDSATVSEVATTLLDVNSNHAVFNEFYQHQVWLQSASAAGWPDRRSALRPLRACERRLPVR